jgi:acyl phosphate:glycerol-3-phosphate acyltransferase
VPRAVSGILLVAASFLAGAVPWGYLAGKLSRGIDLRRVGSGGTGATNVLRTLGRGAAIAVLVLDFLKGLLPVVMARAAGFAPEWVAAAGVAAVAGHCWSPFIGFKGGKGVATGAGVALALFPPAIVALPVLALVVWRTRFVSLGSLIAAAIAGLLAVVFAADGRLAWPSAVAIVAVAGIIVYRHRENIERLRRGTERRFGEKVAT